MQLYEFTLTLNTEPDLDTIDRLYAYFGAQGAAPEGVQDFTVTSYAGVSVADCTVEAGSFDAALQLVLPGLRAEGLRAVRVEVDEEGLAVLQAAA